MNNVFEQVEKNIDNLVVNQADWIASATKKEPLLDLFTNVCL